MVRRLSLTRMNLNSRLTWQRFGRFEVTRDISPIHVCITDRNGCRFYILED